jgi:uncharacterized membrane protein
MTFGQILDRTYRLVRTHLGLFLGIAAVPSVAAIVAVALMLVCAVFIAGVRLGGNPHVPPAFPAYWTAILIGVIYLIFPVISALYMPAASYAATQANRGVRVTFGESYGVAWQRFGRYLWLIVLMALYVIVPFAGIAALIGGGTFLVERASGTSAAPGTAFFVIPLLLLLYLGMLVYSILIMLRFALAFPASVVEGLTAWDSLERSARLTHGAKGRIFLVMLIVYAFTYLVNIVFMAVLAVVAVIVGIFAMMAHVTQGSPAFYVLCGLAVLGYLLILLVTTVTTYAAFTTALGVIYHDQRLRKDGPPPAPAAVAEPA